MTIKQHGGVFGRNPTFNDVDVDNDISISGDANITGKLGVGGSNAILGFYTEKDNGSGYIAGFRSNNSSPYLTVQTTGGVTNLQGINSGFTDVAAIGLQPSGGNINVGNGNFVMSSGYGIDFSATSGTGTSELFDDYEEGTWTANLAMSSGSVGYGSQLGKYVKVGNQVTVNAWIYLNAVSSPAGALSVALPFTIPSTATRPGSYVMNNNLTGVTGQTAGWVNPSTANLLLVKINNGAMSNLDGTSLQVGSELYISITYLV